MIADKIAAAVNAVAWRYARRCWWAEPQDLIQEGWVTAMETTATWRAWAALQPPGVATDEYQVNYVRRAVTLRLSRYLWEQSAPVTGGSKPERELKGLFRAPLLGVEPADWRDPMAAVAEAQGVLLLPELQDQLRDRLLELAQRDLAWAQPEVIDAAIYVLADGARSAQAALEEGVAVESVYRATEYLKRSACSDGIVRDILEDLNELRSEMT